MSTPIRWFSTGVFCLILAAIACPDVWGMGQESFGPAGEHISRSGDWPKGVETVLRHPSRVYWNWVNGNEHAYYDGDIATINELVDLFSQVDIQVHHVVVRPGRPSARSFHGKLTPYTVEFELPSGLYLHHVHELAATGLYSLSPRLIVHVNEELAQHLDELKVPSNISLRGRAYRIEDAIARMNAQDRSLRGRAIEILGEAGDSSAIVTEALHQAAADGDEYIQNAAQRALKQIEQAEDPLIEKLEQQVDAFLDNHPQRFRIPSPQELLDRLREIDDQYAKGFTAKGTLIQPTLSDPDHLIAWTVTMGNDRMIIQKQAVEDTDHPPASGRLEDTIYIGPDRMAMIHRERIWVDGKLIDTKPHATLEPVGSTYDLLMGRIVWPIGRCFSRRIDRITQVTADADGMLKVMAESDEGNLKMRWEMWIDPSADCLVRSAKAFCHGQSDPSYIVDNAGLFGSTNRCIAHTARWSEGVYARPISISVTSVSDKRDDALIQRTEDWLNLRSDQEQAFSGN